VRRLYLRIYLGFLAMLTLVFVAGPIVFWRGPGGRRDRELLRGAGTLVQAALPPPSAAAAELEAGLARLGRELGADLAVFDAGGRVLAAVGRPVPAPDGARAASHWLHDRRGPAAALRLGDGRFVVARFPDRGHGLAWIPGLALLGGALALAAYPVARGITRRLERLERHVDALGAGDLAARAPVEGRDEVARLAQRFNAAAERIEALVRAERTLLASASHALRSPLARLRVAAELAGERGQPELAKAMASDVALLDEGVEELLLASRLDLLDATGTHESVDLLGLAAEEAARAGGEARGEPAAIRGDARSLRHLLRNLLENARRHAPGAPPEVEVERTPAGGARVRVLDRGPGVPEAERARVFEPFARGAGASAPGSGLGLALVRRVARHHGGDARCLPRPGGGACFEVDLPGRPAPAPSPARPGENA
jgi:signal transduction histidine kinase